MGIRKAAEHFFIGGFIVLTFLLLITTAIDLGLKHGAKEAIPEPEPLRCALYVVGYEIHWFEETIDTEVYIQIPGTIPTEKVGAEQICDTTKTIWEVHHTDRETAKNYNFNKYGI